MTTYHIRLALALLENLFPDDNCKQVASYLNRKGPLPLRLLIRDMNLPAKAIARALATLSMHDIIEFHSEGDSNASQILYEFNLKRTLFILHYSKCIHCARQLYGYDGELIIEELLLNGRQRMSTILVKVYQRLIQAGKDPEQHSLQSIKGTFQSLVSAQFLQRLVVEETTSNLPKVTEHPVSNTNQVPELTQDGWKYLLITQRGTDESQTKTTTAPNLGDEKIFWRVNYQRFFAHLRDQELIAAFQNRIDQTAADIIRTILHLAETRPDLRETIPISFIEIAKAVPKFNPQITEDQLQKYLSIMTNDVNQCLTRIGDQGRGTYVIYFQKALAGLTRAHIQSFLRERFGSNALRIYNMLEERGCLSQKEIETMAMINAKEAQQYVYSMFIDGILTLEELSKTSDYNPSRTFYFFRVNLYNGVLSLLDHSYKTMSNLMQRSIFEKDRHRKLIDKRDKVEAILQALREQNAPEEQIREVEDILPPTEKSQIQKLDAALRKIELAQLQLTETILLLEMFLTVSIALIPPAKKTGSKAAMEKFFESIGQR